MKLAWEKSFAIPGLVVTTVMTLFLLVAHLSGWSSSVHQVNLMRTHKASVAVAVQIIAHLLGTLQVYALCNYRHLSMPLPASNAL